MKSWSGKLAPSGRSNSRAGARVPTRRACMRAAPASRLIGHIFCKTEAISSPVNARRVSLRTLPAPAMLKSEEAGKHGLLVGRLYDGHHLTLHGG